MPNNHFTDLALRGEFEAWEVWPNGKRILLYTDANQIQYAGANLLARALVSSSNSMPQISGIITTSSPQSVSPINVPIARSSTNLFSIGNDYQSALNFQATPSGTIAEQQVVISRGAYAGYLGTGRYYEFDLVVTNNIPLAYKYIEGGLSWGVGAMLEIVWTLFLGIS